MLRNLALAALALSPAALAAPVQRNNGGAGNFGVSDPNILVLQFAAFLEALESAYYSQGLAAFNASSLEAGGFSANLSQAVIAQLTVFGEDEKKHSAYIDGVLTGAGLDLFYKTCTIDFSGTLDTVLAYAAYARAFENIGVGAYIGAAPLLDDSTLIAASTIATVEARHSSFLNLINGGDYSPSPYDISLAPSSVATLVLPYVSGCDIGASLGIMPGTPLTATIAEDGKVSFMIDGQAQIEGFAHMIWGGLAESVVVGAEQAALPSDIPNGPVYIYLSGSETPIANNAATADLSAVFAGPALAFVDNNPLSLLAAL